MSERRIWFGGLGIADVIPKNNIAPSLHCAALHQRGPNSRCTDVELRIVGREEDPCFPPNVIGITAISRRRGGRYVFFEDLSLWDLPNRLVWLETGTPVEMASHTGLLSSIWSLDGALTIEAVRWSGLAPGVWGRSTIITVPPIGAGLIIHFLRTLSASFEQRPRGEIVPFPPPPPKPDR